MKDEDKSLELEDGDFELGDSELVEEPNQSGREWTIKDMYDCIYGWATCYDEPWNAMLYCNVTSPKYRGGDFWEQWKHDHYVGDEGLEERAMKDRYVRSKLRKVGLLPEKETEGRVVGRLLRAILLEKIAH